MRWGVDGSGVFFFGPIFGVILYAIIFVILKWTGIL